MRICFCIASVLGFTFLLASHLVAADEKEVILKGTITCAKCDLKQSDKCATVIKVHEGDTDVVYWFDPSSHKQNHKSVCMDPKAGTVTGTVSEKDGKKWIKVTKLDFGD
jgi:Family of unknown function (DUF6370)